MERRTLGSSGPEVGALGLGLMGMSDSYGTADRSEAIATIHAAMDAGVNLLDTGDFYGMGHNETLLGTALAGRRRDQVVISVKFGVMRDPGGGMLGVDASPRAVKNFLTYTLRRLGTDHVDIYRPARLDERVPIEDTVGAIAEMVRAGYVRHAGLSEVGADTLRRAHTVHPIADLQIEYSLFSRGIERAVLPAARELGVAITAYGVLARGLLSGHWSGASAGEGVDYRRYMPRFAPGNIEGNLALVEALRAVAGAKGITVAQAAIAWVLSRGADIVPVVGARRRDRLAESLGALDAVLTDADLAEIESAVPEGAVAGDRYDPGGMRRLDSERG